VLRSKLQTQVNGMLLEGKKVFVGPFLKRTDRPNDKETNFTNVFVKNLSDDVDDEKLDKMFSEFGKVRCSISLQISICCAECLRVVLFVLRLHCNRLQVTSAVVMRDDAGKSKGFGFVNYDEADAANKAVDALNGKEIEGKELYVGRAQKKSEREAELKQK
jgi:polyadenylate-binding protein